MSEIIKANFRWDRWISGAVFAGLATFGTGTLLNVLSDGVITKNEWLSLAGVFATGFFGWIKQHPIVFTDSVFTAAEQVEIRKEVGEAPQSVVTPKL